MFQTLCFLLRNFDVFQIFSLCFTASTLVKYARDATPVPGLPFCMYGFSTPIRLGGFVDMSND